MKEQNQPQLIELPEPVKDGQVSLEETLSKRRSVRTFKGRPISLPMAGQLLWSAQGFTRGSKRTTPSAGALYPLEIHLLAADVEGLAPGLYRYLPKDHAVLQTSSEYLRKKLTAAALHQEAIHHAPAVFVITGIPDRITIKYGDRGIRYMYMEAGHAAQNILLQAVALELGSVVIGAFYDDEVAGVLGLGETETPLYIIPVGLEK